MEDDPDWRALLNDYQATLDEFERISKALTAALVDRDSATEDLPELFAAESRARDAVILARMRLVNAWRDSQPDLRLPTAGNALRRDDSNDR
jgi:hypothetical protein